MSSIQYEITLDLKRDYHQVLVMKEGDVDSREIIATIVDNGKPFDISGCTAKFKWHKPDHKYVFDDCIIQEGKVHIECDEQMLVVGGLANVEVVLYDIDGQTVVSTMKFDVSIKDSVISNKDIESTDEFGSLNNLILSNKNLNDSLRQLESDVEIAEEQRIENEDNRIKNEINRNSAETDRQINTANAVTLVNEAKQSAISATDEAKKATEATTEATKSANTATQNANTAITEMKKLMANDNIVHVNKLGVAGGVATLDEEGFLSRTQIPDRTIEIIYGTLQDNKTFLDINGEVVIGGINKQYIDTVKGIPYIWSGIEYVATGSKLGLGYNSSSAFPGSDGLDLQNRMKDVEEYHNNIPASDIKFDNADTAILGANVQDAIVELTSEATHTKAGLLSAEDKKRIDNYADVQVIDITLYASNWTGSEAPYSQIVTVDGIDTYNNCSVEIPTTATADELYAMTGASVHYDESIGFTFTVDEKPTIDIPIQLCVGTSMNITEVPKYIGESPVLGVKGDNETDYRNGYVSLTKENIGLENVNNTADAEKSVKYAASAGSANAVAWENVSGKPSAFPPSAHGHTWNDVSGKPNTFPPSAHGHHIGIHEAAGSNVLSNFVSELELNSNKISTFRTNGVVSNVPMYGSGIAFRTGNTHGYLSMAYGGAEVYAGGGNGSGINWSTRLLTANDSCNKNWNWSGQGGQPNWLWGGNDGSNMFVYNPINFNVASLNVPYGAGGVLKCIWDGTTANFGMWANTGGTIDGVFNNGFAYSRWNTVFSVKGTINTSDRNQKDKIKPLEEWHYQLFLKLIPSSFIFKDGGDRTHVGFISQDVEDALHELGKTAMDFAGFCKDVKVKPHLDEDGNVVNEPVLDEDGNPVYIYSLRYSEFIALITYAVQNTISRLNEQSVLIENLEKRLSALENKEEE